jgi:predicted TIM-barrel fold metal-dependent hydrolase
LCSQFKSINVVLDHMGCLPLGKENQLSEKNEQVLKQWREGMKAVSMQQNVYVKLTAYPFIRENFENEKAYPTVSKLVQETIQFFGSERCMLGSNYPVDKYQGASLSKIMDFARKIVGEEVCLFVCLFVCIYSFTCIF